MNPLIKAANSHRLSGIESLLSTLVYLIAEQDGIREQDGILSQIVKRAGWNKRAGGDYATKS